MRDCDQYHERDNFVPSILVYIDAFSTRRILDDAVAVQVSGCRLQYQVLDLIMNDMRLQRPFTKRCNR